MLVKPWWIWKCSSSWEHAQALGVIIGTNWDSSQFPRLCYNFSNKWTHYLLLSFSPVTKIIPCVVSNKVIHIIHSSLGMPFLCTLQIDCWWIALGWYKEFQWSLNQREFFLPPKGIYLRVTIPKVSHCGIMATQLLATLTIVYHLLKCGIVVYLVTLVICLTPSLQMYASRLSSRDVATTHFVSWS